MQFCAPAFIARIAVSSPSVSETIRNGTSMSRSFSSESASNAPSVCRGEVGEHHVPRAARQALSSNCSRGVDTLDVRLKAAATQLLGEERGVGRGVVQHECPNRNAHL